MGYGCRMLGDTMVMYVFICACLTHLLQMPRGADAGCTCCRGKHYKQPQDVRAGGEIKLCRQLQYVRTREAKGEEEARTTNP